ncbi:zinc-binding dehydrogenase [Nemania sp. FL0916]|nr:zinc-binding dehydrogenase [Nemania sp. FL0916]
MRYKALSAVYLAESGLRRRIPTSTYFTHRVSQAIQVRNRNWYSEISSNLPTTTSPTPQQPKMKAFVTVEGRTAAVREIAKPTPSAGEILVRVHYAAQNPTDWKSVPGRPPGRIVGCDFAGTVADANGSAWRVGQRVAGFVYGTMADPLRGAYAEYLVAEPSLVFAVPDEVSLRDASTISLALATAVQALFQRLGLPESGASGSALPILINGATSSVGLYAVQLAKLAGLYVIATGSERNHGLLKDLGADVVVDYNDAAWPSKVRELTHDNLQHALDTIAEKATTESVARAISPTKGGHVLCILPRKSAELPADLGHVKVESTIVYTVFGHAIDLKGAPFDNWGGPTPQDRTFWEQWIARLPKLLAAGTIRANPSRELGGLETVAEGFELQKQGKIRAQKLVYKIASEE